MCLKYSKHGCGMKYFPAFLFLFCATWHSFAQDNSYKLHQYSSSPSARALWVQAVDKYDRNENNNDTILAAVDLLNAAIGIDHNYYNAYERKAHLLTVVQKYQSALDVVNEMIRLNPGSAE